MARGQDAHRIAELLDKLERTNREIGRSVDARGELNRERLGRARESLVGVLDELDQLLERPS